MQILVTVVTVVTKSIRANGSLLGDGRKHFGEMHPASLNGTMRLPERYNQPSTRRKARK